MDTTNIRASLIYKSRRGILESIDELMLMKGVDKQTVLILVHELRKAQDQIERVYNNMDELLST